MARLIRVHIGISEARWYACRMVFILLLLPVLFSGESFAGNRVLRVRDGAVIDYSTMLEEMKGVRLILIGENHDRKQHHDDQLAIIRLLAKKGRPLAVGMEMFAAASQPELDMWTEGKLERSKFIELYYRNWQLAWPLYSEILDFTRSVRIPLVGLNVPREITRKVAQSGFASLSEQERKELPAGITCDIDAAYKTFIRKAFAMHGVNDKMFDHFCEAQMLWTKAMAFHITDYLHKQQDKVLVVLIGTGHAMKGGIPAQIAEDNQFRIAVIVPEMTDPPPARFTTNDADYILLQ